MTLEQEIAAVLNRHSLESESNTPDFILARYMLDCLAAWSMASQAREKWYGGHLEPARLDGPWVADQTAEQIAALPVVRDNEKCLKEPHTHSWNVPLSMPKDPDPPPEAA